MLRALFAVGIATAVVASSALARDPSSLPVYSPPTIGPRDGSLFPEPRFALAAVNTTELASFSFGTGVACDTQGWTVVDATAVPGIFWHVDDFAGVNVRPGDVYAPIAGAKSLWCGARPSGSEPTCSYATLPGYGDSWNQGWQTKACIAISGSLNVSFSMKLDSEPGFDATFLEFTNDCTPPFQNWLILDGGLGTWDGIQSVTVNKAYAVGASAGKVRIRFHSDGAYSDQDGIHDSHSGPVIVDNLQVEALPLENFEGEAVGATSSEDWEAVEIPGYGASYMALFPGRNLIQEGSCARNVSCVWAAIKGSTETYACGGYPLQAAVPKGNAEGQYFNAEIQSPWIPLSGSGNVVNLQFSVYLDNPLDNLVFYYWSVRSRIPGQCADRWHTDGNFYFNDTGMAKNWNIDTYPIGGRLNLSPGAEMQVGLGIIDACGFFCGDLGSGACHSHAPLVDNVRVYRADVSGPVWTIRDIDMFQDTFPSDGTDTGFGRADPALGVFSNGGPSVPPVPQDSCVFTVVDPATATVLNPSGLANDGIGKAVYCWTRVVGKEAKTNALVSTYGGKDIQVADGKNWARMQVTTINSASGRFSIDLPDDVLFAAGDVVEFFFSATNTGAVTSYCSGSALNYVQNDLNLAAQIASEFTILPLGGGVSTDILYVDGMDGRGAQVYWDTAFQQLGLTPDRYDVRAPSSAVHNRPGSRVEDVAAQLNARYKKIVWDCGDLSVTLGGGVIDGVLRDRSDDFAMINTFLDGLTTTGGVYICGDDFPEKLAQTANASAVTFKTTFVTYTLTTNNHRPAYGVTPGAVGKSGGAFNNDTWLIYGGCPLLNDFDVMAPTGGTAMHSSYGPTAANNGAEIGKITTPTSGGGTAKAMISGYSFIYVRDDETDGTLDRAKHLQQILTYLGGSYDQPTDTGPIAANRLEQNYPNPFNPQTTIAFSIKERGRVVIDVYNVAGQLVRTLIDETRAAGSYTDVRWDGTDANNAAAASGIYFYRLTTDGFSQTRKMVLLK